MEAILDAILDFRPLECEGKNGTLIFLKAYDILFQSQVSFFLLRNNIHELLLHDK